MLLIHPQTKAELERELYKAAALCQGKQSKQCSSGET